MSCHEEVLQRSLELNGDLPFKSGDAFCLGEIEQDEYCKGLYMIVKDRKDQP